MTSLPPDQRPGRLRIGVVVAAFGLAFGLGSIALAIRPPGLSFAASSPPNVFLELAAGWSLIMVGVASWTRSTDRHPGLILSLAGLAWFVGGWANPGTGSAVAFTAGLVLSASPTMLVGQIVLEYPGGRPRDRRTHLLIGIAYGTNLLVIGLLPTLLYAPAAVGCSQCPPNLLRLGSDAALGATIGRGGLTLEVLWIAMTVALLSLRVIHATRPARRATLPVVAPGVVFLALSAIGAIHGVERGALGLDDLAELLWQGQAITVVALAAGVAFGWVRARRIRSRVARLVVELAASPRGTGLRDKLSELLDDPDLRLAYRVADGRLVDHDGRSIVLDGRSTRMVTPLVRDGQEVAVLDHRPGLEDDPVQMREIVNAARLSLENERLQALAQARLADVRRSRVRIVEAGDDERRRLERDLHDGAQQRLVSLSIALRMLRRRLAAGDDATSRSSGVTADLLDQADSELRAALVDLREVAHGIYPAVLGEEGLAAGVESLVEGSPTHVTVDAVPEERVDAPVEVAAYLVVAEGLRRAAGRPARVEIRHVAGTLSVDVAHDGESADVTTDLEDRIGALNGTIVVWKSDDGHVRIHAEMPCAS